MQNHSSEFNQEQRLYLRHAKKIAWITLGYFGSVVLLMALVVGASQSMKSTWIEDMLSLLPPTVFLIGSHFCQKKPTRHFSYGFHRVITIGFFFAAMALLLMGSFLFIDGLIVLISQEHPTVGYINIKNHTIWLGWLMILVMIWGTIPSLFLGRIKLKLAKKLYDKILYTDSEMNRDDWLVGIVTLSAVIGLGFGIWWLDAVGGVLISLNVLKDGIKQTKESIVSLIDSSPKTLEGNYMHLENKIEALLGKHQDIAGIKVKLRDQGHIIFGEGFLTLKKNSIITPQQCDKLLSEIHQLDWRLKNFVLTIQEN